MRFLSIYKTVERGTPPPPEEMAKMGKLVEDGMKAGFLLAVEGCLPSATGARIRISNGNLVVTDGPFTESKEVIGGLAILQANSKQEAVELARQFLQVAGDGECELRQLFEGDQKKCAQGAAKHSVTPYLIISGAARAIDFYQRAFGATEIARLPGPNGKLMHAEIKIGDSSIMLADECLEMGDPSPQTLKGSSVSLYVYVEDVDAVFERAVKAGARATRPPQDMFWGDRFSKLVDPFGHVWSLATHKEDVSPEEVKRRSEAFAQSMKATPAV